jgi:hypothetical protein
MHPVPQGLPVQAAGLGRGFSVNAIKHKRNCQHPSRRPRMLRLSRRQPYFCRHQILPRDLNSHPSLHALNRMESQFKQAGSLRKPLAVRAAA